ncbi:MAG: NAD(P)-binding domain-containing protein, partial [Algoriella sp.]
MSNEKKVAIIGVGNIGTAIATNTVKGNRPVILASRKLEDAEALSNKLGDLATAAEIPDAINQADI